MGLEYQMVEELMAGHADELYVFRTNIWQLVLESRLDEETVSGYVAQLAKNEVSRRLADNKESVQQLLDVLKEKDPDEFSIIFNIEKRRAQHLTYSLIGDRFFTLIDPEMSPQEKMKEAGLSKNTFYNYLSALKELVPGIGSPRGMPLDKQLEGLEEYIIDLLKIENLSMTGIIDGVVKRYGIASGGKSKSEKKWRIIDAVDNMERIGSIVFKDGFYGLSVSNAGEDRFQGIKNPTYSDPTY